MHMTYQHKAVKQAAIVIEKDGGKETVTLRSKKERARYTDWFLYSADHKREFATVDEAEAVGRSVCPIFHGTGGPVAELPCYVVDAWGHWVGM